MARDERRLAGKNPGEEESYQKSHEIWSLTNKLQKMRELLNFTVEDPQQGSIREKIRIEQVMDLLGSELESILHGHDITLPLKCPIVVPGSQLHSLVQGAFGQDTAIGQEKPLLRSAIAKFQPTVVIRCLVVAALREWVFMSNFPNFGTTLLLQAYRDSIMVQGNRLYLIFFVR